MGGSRDKLSGFKRLISFDEATSRVRDIQWRKLDTVEVGVESAIDMICAEEVYSDYDIPPYDRSAMDGFAVRHEDVHGASPERPVSLSISGSASNKIQDEVKPGSCIRVNTGSRIPDGADSVVMKEYTRESDGSVLIDQPPRKWENVSRKGEDMTSGTKVAGRGERLMSWHIAMLIAIGRQKILVFKRIKLGVLSTGDEIFPGSGSGIPNTTQPLLLNYFRSGYVETVNAGMSRDDFGKIKEAVLRALDRNDVLVVTGGSSVGSPDISSDVLDSLGNTVFRGIMIKPGRTISMYCIDDKPVYLVSGLPVAALTSFEALFDAFSKDVYGFEENRQVIRARLKGRIINSVGMRTFVRLFLSRGGETLDAMPMRASGSGVLSSLLDSNGLATIPENSEGVEEGEYIWVALTGGPV